MRSATNSEEKALVWLDKAERLREQEEYAEAVTAARKCLDAYPQCGTAWVSLGLSLSELGAQEAAKKAYSGAIDANDWLDSGAGLAVAYKQLGMIESEQDNFEAAISLYRQSLNVVPGDARVLALLGKDLILAEKLDEAKSALMSIDDDRLAGYWDEEYGTITAAVLLDKDPMWVIEIKPK